MPPIRRKRKSRTTAPCVVYFTKAKNEEGKVQLCVFVECTYAGGKAGPVWSHTAQAVRRALATLSGRCECGRKFHKSRFTEGQRIMPKRMDR